MEDYTKYTLESASAVLISVIAYRLYRMRCNTSSKCCGDRFEADFHNSGGSSLEIDNHPPSLPSLPPQQHSH